MNNQLQICFKSYLFVFSSVSRKLDMVRLIQKRMVENVTKNS